MKLLIRIIFIANLPLAFSTAQEINGFGANLSSPLYIETFRLFELHTKVKVHYSTVGSKTAIQKLLTKNADFVASGMLLSNAQQSQVALNETNNSPNTILHIPTAIAAVVPAYNFAPLYKSPQITLDGKTLGAIFLGKILFWDDEAIIKLNPDTQLPNLPIVVIYNNGVSGTNSIFADYLRKASPLGAQEIVFDSQGSVAWPVGFGESSNEDVVKMIAQTPGAIGYTTLAEAELASLGIAKLINAAGNVVSPTVEALSKAADNEVSENLQTSITNTSNEQSWPLSGFIWILLYQDQNYAGRSIYQAELVKNLVAWLLSEGQGINKNFGYAPLNEKTRAKAQQLLEEIYYTTFD